MDGGLCGNFDTFAELAETPKTFEDDMGVFQKRLSSVALGFWSVMNVRAGEFTTNESCLLAPAGTATNTEGYEVLLVQDLI